jgi:hypothetical protein
MKLKIILVLLLALCGCATSPVNERAFDLSRLPNDSNPWTYILDDFIPAAMSLQAMGSEAGSQALLRAAEDVDYKYKAGHGGWYDYEKVIVLCRMLFNFREGVRHPYPALGERVFFGDTTYSDWPLEPIELVDGYPFWIVRGFNMGGARSGDAASRFVSYCVTNCEWNKFKYRQMSINEKRAALEKLLRSPKWKRPLDQAERSILSLQIVGYPPKNVRPW